MRPALTLALALLGLATTCLAAPKPWAETFRDRLSWWSLQPVENPAKPDTSDPAWPRQPLDHFTLATLDRDNLKPATDADARTLLRRLHFVLTGLPPGPDSVDAFLEAHAADPDAAVAAKVDELLGSIAYAERFARHWMDWLRYADSHGSEGDPAIPHAWRYRDYLVRALDADVPYDQLVREHVAGDLLTEPRIDPETGIDESALATAHYRFVFHGFAPTDALDELVRFTDNQIDVVTKAFQAQTVSCARCHDHKFDAISHKDYYALFGTFAATRPATKTVDDPAKLNAHDETLAELKTSIRRRLADAWLAELPDDTSPPPPVKFDPIADNAAASWSLADPDTFTAWPKHGSAFASGKPSPAGDFHIAPDGDRVLTGIFPGGVVSHSLSSKHSAVLTSPRFMIPENHVLWVRAAGGDAARLRYAVQHYPRNGTVYPIKDLKNERLEWHRFDLTYWSGDYAHVEIATGADNPIVGDPNRQRSWFAITGAKVLPKDAAKPATPDAPTDPASLHAAVTAWRDGKATDLHAESLARALAEDKLTNTLDKLPGLAPLVAKYRDAEAHVPVPTRAPGVLDTPGHDWPLYERGDHKKPTVPVVRRYLSAIDEKPYQTHQTSGRLQLADSILDPENPLTARVLVNRLWHHLFGTGIVPTTDNFGQLGELPSDPQLLDHLAHEFVHTHNYSLKSLVRAVATSRTFRLATASGEPDPGIHYAPVRRLEAEAIRDAVLAAAGRLTEDRFGPPAGANDPRRSVYLRVQRNNLHPLLTTFDAPEPLTTRGRRNVTNVPAQSLALLNDPFVKNQAAALASVSTGEPADRVHTLFTRALSRPPTEDEAANALAFVDRLRTSSGALRQQLDDAWTQLNVLEETRWQLLEPVRERLFAERQNDQPDEVVLEGDPPVASFDWTTGNHTHQLTARGSARVEDGAAVLDGGGHFTAPPLDKPLRARTLEVVVQLDTLDQSGGGALTIQTNDGHTFDSIVFAELSPRQWLTGSNFHSRTAPFDGPAEDAAHETPVHLAFSYAADGTVTAYRDGEPYGKPVRKAGLQHYTPGGAHLAIGLRHGPAGTNSGSRMLRGKVFKAALYDRALDADEIAALAGGGTARVTTKQVLAALTEPQRNELARLDTAIASTRKQVETLERSQTGPDPWHTLAHSLFNLKEFIYLR